MSDNSSMYKLNKSADSYFLENGTARMILSPSAAEGVCTSALAKGQLVTVVEGGIWRDPQFEARLDCIWWGSLPPLSWSEAKENNELAKKFITSETPMHSAFIVTTVSVNDVAPAA